MQPLTIHRTGDIPSFKLYETEKTLAFMDIQPLSKGHAVCVYPIHTPLLVPPSTRSSSLTSSRTQLIIPKYHAERLPEVPDEYLTELLVRASPPPSLSPLTTRAGDAGRSE